MQPLVTSPRKDIHKRKLVLGMSVGVVKAEKCIMPGVGKWRLRLATEEVTDLRYLESCHTGEVRGSRFIFKL